MRYSGKIGFGHQVEVSPGIWEDTITERDYLIEVVTKTERLTTGDTILPEYALTTSLSVFSDGVLKENYRDIRYVTYRGFRWAVSSSAEQWPRLTLYIGEEYNGPEPDSTP